MQLSDTLKPATGVWTFTAYEGDKELDEHGDILNPVVWSQTKTNLIVNTGKQLMLDRLFGLSAAVALSGMAVGTSATAAAVGDTTITGAAYKAFASAPTRSGLVVTAITSYLTSEANINIQEAGLLTASGGVLFNRLAPIGPFNKTTAVSLDVTIQITQS
jgi:hypothetical protein